MLDTALAALWLTLAGLLGLTLLLLLCTWLLHRAARRLERQAQPGLPPPWPQWYYQRPGETPRGPVELTALRAMLADGRLGADALAAQVGSADWRPLAHLRSGQPGELP